jgi:hypothetical protein
MSEYGFVIQPFDQGKFDKRYTDVFEPAIRQLDGVEPYRVDEDASVNIPIETIEEKIKNCRFCLADITTDNPNVWYEVGFALAFGKDVILVCSSNERTTPYPFDIRHRSIISYKTESSSDFDDLRDKIVKRATAVLKKPMVLKSPVNINIDIDGLGYQELALLGAFLKNQDSPDSGVSTWGLKEDMKKSGLNEIAFNLAVRKLLKKGIMKCDKETDYNGNEYSVYYLTEAGDAWVIENDDKFNINEEDITVEGENHSSHADDDLQF